MNNARQRSNSEDAEALARERIRDMLKRGERIKVDSTGKLVPANAPAAENAINVPEGELAYGCFLLV